MDVTSGTVSVLFCFVVVTSPYDNPPRALLNIDNLSRAMLIKVVGYPVYLRSTNLEIHAERLFVFLIC